MTRQIQTRSELLNARRAQKTVTHRGDLDSTGVFYYDGAREIAEYNSAETTGTLTQAYVWGTQYVDELLMMFGQNGAYFAWQDANWLVSGLTTPGGRLAEEYNYTPYGRVLARRHTVFGDGDGDGDIDATDEAAFADARDNTYNRDFDANWNGATVADESDEDAFDAQSLQGKADKSVTVDARAFSPTGNPYLYTGRRLDAETGIYYYRARNYHPGHKQFIQRDPLGYEASGPTLYGYVFANPLSSVDPSGMAPPLMSEEDFLVSQLTGLYNQEANLKAENKSMESKIGPLQRELDQLNSELDEVHSAWRQWDVVAAVGDTIEMSSLITALSKLPHAKAFFIGFSIGKYINERIGPPDFAGAIGRLQATRDAILSLILKYQLLIDQNNGRLRDLAQRIAELEARLDALLSQSGSQKSSLPGFGAYIKAKERARPSIMGPPSSLAPPPGPPRLIIILDGCG